jgi:hypothetical protein
MNHPARRWLQQAAAPLFPHPLPTLLIVYAAQTLVVVALLGWATRSRVADHWLLTGALVTLAMLISQAGFLSFWAVWAPQPPLTRMLVSLLATATIYLESVIVWAVSNKNFMDISEGMTFLLVMPLIFFSSQVPQWLMKFALGGQICYCASDEPADRGARRFTLAQLFGATAAVAASLAGARLITSLDGLGAGEAAMTTLLLFGVAAGVGLLFCVPCTWAVLIAPNVRRGIAVLTAYGTLSPLALIGALLAIVGFQDGDVELGWSFLFLIILIGGPLLGLSISLAALRSAGYRICKVTTTPNSAS